MSFPKVRRRADKWVGFPGEGHIIGGIPGGSQRNACIRRIAELAVIGQCAEHISKRSHVGWQEDALTLAESLLMETPAEFDGIEYGVIAWHGLLDVVGRIQSVKRSEQIISTLLNLWAAFAAVLRPVPGAS